MEWLNFSAWQSGGLMMWPLLLLGAIALMVFFERLLLLHKSQIKTSDFLAGLKNLLRKQRLVEALAVCEETPGPVASLLRSGLVNFDRPEDELRRAIQAAALVEIPLLERRVGTLAAIARTAPMLGLLGTIIGMYEAYSVIGQEGDYVTFSLVAQGFAEALVSTAAGLTIAILAYLGYHFLYGRVRALVHDMEYAGHELMEFILQDLPVEEQTALQTNPSETAEARNPT